MKIITAEAVFRCFEPYLFSKYSGIVDASRYFDMVRVRLPRMTHASSEPMTALPMPIQVAEAPYDQPNCPA